jgi:hypothetical protein
MLRSAYSLIVATFTIAIFLVCGTARAAEFPYNAYVTAGEAFAMSGPNMVGEYRTERLERGQRVTVYQQVPGWCAIRPPHGAHSWIDGRYLDQVNADTARTKVAKVPSFIGSTLQARRDKYQITLDAGEMVQVVAVTETSAGIWYKIAPPAGEFRWVSSAELGREPAETSQVAATTGPINTTPMTATAHDPPPTYPGTISNTAIAAGTPAAVAATDPALAAPGQISQWQTADSSRWRNLHPGTIVSTSGTGQVIAQAPQQPVHPVQQVVETKPWAPASNTSPASPPASSVSTVPLGGTPSTTMQADNALSRSIQNQLEALELDLSAMLSEEPTAWSFSSFNQRSDKLLDQAGSALERGKVRIFQNKLARFAEIKQRTLDQQALLGTQPTRMREKIPAATTVATAAASPYTLPKQSTDWVPGARPGSMIASQGIGLGGPLKAPATITDPVMGRYDAIGKLMPVVAKRPNAPKFALVDANNKVVSFVSPGPGVEMQAYVGQQIGVMGSKGYMPELQGNPTHITATTIGPTDPATIARMRADQKFR